MKRKASLLLPVIVVALLLFFSAIPVEAAPSHRLASFDCTGGCFAEQSWGDYSAYPVDGASTNVNISNPTMGPPSGLWERYLYVSNCGVQDGVYSCQNSAASNVLIGIEKSYLNGGGECGNEQANTLYYFFEWAGKSGGFPQPSGCNLTPAPTNSINKTVYFTLEFLPMQDITAGIIDDPTQGVICDAGLGCSCDGTHNGCIGSWDYINESELFTQQIVNNHAVWGVAWNSNKWISTSGNNASNIFYKLRIRQRRI